jgi:hypothetical protein
MSNVKNETWKVHAIGGGVVTAVAVATWLVVLQPVAQARQTYGALVSRLAGERAGLEAAREAEKNGRMAAEAAAASLAAHPLVLEPATAVNQRLQAVSELAGAAGVRVDTIEAGRPDGFEKYGVLPVQLSGRGTFAGLRGFLEGLQTQMPDMEVAASEVSGRYTEKGMGQSVLIKLRWHTAPQAESAAGGGR